MEISIDSSLTNLEQVLQEYRQITTPKERKKISSNRISNNNNNNSQLKNESDYNEIINTIETMEQELIQHIRTAGIKKTREFTLIDEILNIKKNRRQMFTILIKEIENIHQENNNLQDLLINEKEKNKKKLEDNLSELRLTLDTKNKQIEKLETKYKTKVESLHIKYQEQIQNEKLLIERKYENRLKELEGIVERVQQAKEKKENMIEESKNKQFYEVELQKQEQHYLTLIKRYKDGLKSLVEKEKTLETSLITLQTSQNNLKNENSALEIQCDLLKKELLTEKNLHLEVKQENNELKLKLNHVIEKYRKLKEEQISDNESIRTLTSQTIQDLQIKHEEELRIIDDKIRSALHSKDELIELLKRELREAVDRARQSEELIDKLNQELTIR